MQYLVWVVNLRTHESFDDFVEAIDEQDAFDQALAIGEEMCGPADADVVQVQPIEAAPPLSYFPGEDDGAF